MKKYRLILIVILMIVGMNFNPSNAKPLKKHTKTKKDPCCTVCPIYGLAVTARDKYTHELLPQTDVAIKNAKGEVVRTATTNSLGVVVFENITADDYQIYGILEHVNLENSGALKKEFICDKVLQKDVLYTDRNFILKGKVLICKTTTPIAGIDILLENKEKNFRKTTLTDKDGNFILQLPEKGTYSLYGKKENYFSEVKEVVASEFNRDKTLFVKLEICAEKADCGKAIGLKNILYDLDKFYIKDISKIELNKLVRFMNDNPLVKVELGSHTDSRASKEYNQTLSQNRATAAVDYIISQGIDKNRITGIGYGENKLLNKCADGINCTEAQHALNRRTEMKVVCPADK